VQLSNRPKRDRLAQRLPCVAGLYRPVWLWLAILFLVLFLLWLAAPGKPVVARIAVKLASPGSSLPILTDVQIGSGLEHITLVGCAARETQAGAVALRLNKLNRGSVFRARPSRLGQAGFVSAYAA
jgi:hypothetical protein